MLYTQYLVVPIHTVPGWSYTHTVSGRSYTHSTGSVLYTQYRVSPIHTVPGQSYTHSTGSVLYTQYRVSPIHTVPGQSYTYSTWSVLYTQYLVGAIHTVPGCSKIFSNNFSLCCVVSRTRNMLSPYLVISSIPYIHVVHIYIHRCTGHTILTYYIHMYILYVLHVHMYKQVLPFEMNPQKIK